MIKPKIFIACDTTDLRKIKQIIKVTKSSKGTARYGVSARDVNGSRAKMFA